MEWIKRMEHIIETEKLKTEKYHQWLRNLITIATGLIGVLISLKSGKSANAVEHYFFVGTIGFIALGVVTGIAILFSDVVVLKRYKRMQLERAQEILDGVEPRIPVVLADRPKVFRLLEWVCFPSLVLGVMCLVAYAIFTDQL